MAQDQAEGGYVGAKIEQQGAFDAEAYSFFGDMAPLDEGLGGALEDGLEAPPEEFPAQGALEDDEDLPIEALMDEDEEDEDLSLAALLRRQMLMKEGNHDASSSSKVAPPQQQHAAAHIIGNGLSKSALLVEQQHQQPLHPPLPPQPQLLSHLGHQQQQQQPAPDSLVLPPAVAHKTPAAPASAAAERTPPHTGALSLADLEARMLSSANQTAADQQLQQPGTQLLTMLRGSQQQPQQQQQLPGPLPNMSAPPGYRPPLGPGHLGPVGTPSPISAPALGPLGPLPPASIALPGLPFPGSPFLGPPGAPLPPPGSLEAIALQHQHQQRPSPSYSPLPPPAAAMGLPPFGPDSLPPPPGYSGLPPPGYNGLAAGQLPPPGYKGLPSGQLPPPGYNGPATGQLPPPGYNGLPSGQLPPPGYNGLAGGQLPPPGYNGPAGGQLPPPGYNGPAGGQLPPPGYNGLAGGQLPPPGYNGLPGGQLPPPGYNGPAGGQLPPPHLGHPGHPGMPRPPHLGLPASPAMLQLPPPIVPGLSPPPPFMGPDGMPSRGPPPLPGQLPPRGGVPPGFPGVPPPHLQQPPPGFQQPFPADTVPPPQQHQQQQQQAPAGPLAPGQPSQPRQQSPNCAWGPRPPASQLDQQPQQGSPTLRRHSSSGIARSAAAGVSYDGFGLVAAPGSVSGMNSSRAPGPVESPEQLVRRLSLNGSEMMAADDINYILRIQRMATHGGHPYLEDFYYQAYLNKYYGARNAVHFAPAELRDLDGLLDNMAPRFADLSGLGRIVLSNIRTPKVLMDLSNTQSKGSAAGEGQKEDAGQQEGKVKARPLEQEPMLAARIMIEDCELLLSDVEDIDRIFAAYAASANALPGAPVVTISPNHAQTLLHRRTALLDGIAASFRLPDSPVLAADGTSAAGGDGVFLRLMGLPKGRALVAKTLRLVFTAPLTAKAGNATEDLESSRSRSTATGLDVIWALLRNTDLAFGPAVGPAAGGEGDRRMTDATIGLAAAASEMVKRVNKPEEAAACLAAAVAGLDVAIQQSGQQLLPLFPVDRVPADASPDWLGSVLASLLLRASELGLGSFAASGIVKTLGEGYSKGDAERAAEQELLLEAQSTSGAASAVAGKWQGLLSRFTKLVLRHLWALAQAVQAGGLVVSAGGASVDLRPSVQKVACVPLIRVLMAHCDDQQQEQLRACLSALK